MTSKEQVDFTKIKKVSFIAPYGRQLISDDFKIKDDTIIIYHKGIAYIKFLSEFGVGWTDANLVEKKENKFTKLYNTIKHKLACAQRDLEIEKNSLTMSLIKLEQLKGQIDAYNDVLSLMESMK